MTARELVDRNVQRFRAMVERMNCSNDDFIRTTEPRHYRAWARSGSAWARRDIYLDKIRAHSVRDEAFYDESETRLDATLAHRARKARRSSGSPGESYFRLSAYQDRSARSLQAHSGFRAAARAAQRS